MSNKKMSEEEKKMREELEKLEAKFEFEKMQLRSQQDPEKRFRVEEILQIKCKENKNEIDRLQGAIDRKIDDVIDSSLANGENFVINGTRPGIGLGRRLPNGTVCLFLSLKGRESIVGETDKMTGVWTAPYWYNKFCETCNLNPNKNHLLFIEELDYVDKEVQSLVEDIIVKHSLTGDKKLPQNCIVGTHLHDSSYRDMFYELSDEISIGIEKFENKVDISEETKEFCEYMDKLRKEAEVEEEDASEIENS